MYVGVAGVMGINTCASLFWYLIQYRRNTGYTQYVRVGKDSSLIGVNNKNFTATQKKKVFFTNFASSRFSFAVAFVFLLFPSVFPGLFYWKFLADGDFGQYFCFVEKKYRDFNFVYSMWLIWFVFENGRIFQTIFLFNLLKASFGILWITNLQRIYKLNLGNKVYL